MLVSMVGCSADVRCVFLSVFNFFFCHRCTEWVTDMLKVLRNKGSTQRERVRQCKPSLGFMTVTCAWHTLSCFVSSPPTVCFAVMEALVAFELWVRRAKASQEEPLAKKITADVRNQCERFFREAADPVFSLVLGDLWRTVRDAQPMPWAESETELWTMDDYSKVLLPLFESINTSDVKLPVSQAESMFISTLTPAERGNRLTRIEKQQKFSIEFLDVVNFVRWSTYWFAHGNIFFGLLCLSHCQFLISSCALCFVMGRICADTSTSTRSELARTARRFGIHGPGSRIAQALH